MDVSNFWWQDAGDGPGPGPDPGDLIGNSLRFRGQNVGSDQEYCLRRSNGTNCQSVRTMSVWIKTVAKQPKPSAILSLGPSFSAAYDAWSLTLNDETNSNSFAFGSNQLGIYFGGASYFGLPPKYRDPSAWYHIVVQTDGADNILFVNGENIGTLSSIERLSGDITIGQLPAAWNLPRTFNGYMAHFYFIDGQTIEPTEFGRYNNQGVWVPIDYDGTYGTNGFYLDFSDPADIGADRSGNGNDFTPTGFELADQTSANWDLMQDSPTQNYSTLNPLFTNGTGSPGTLSKANLKYKSGYFLYKTAPGTIGLKTGKYYWEQVCPFQGSSPNPTAGIIRGTTAANNTYISYDPNGNVFGFGYANDGWIYGDLQVGGVGTTAGGSITTSVEPFGIGDVIAVAADIPNGTVSWYKNNTLVYTISDVGAGTIYDWMPAVSAYDQTEWDVNFGQRPFVYTPPAGFEALQTQNLPEAPIPNGRDHFQAITDTGANILTAAQTAFPNGLWWIKDRANANQHQFVDSVRGGNLALQCPASGADTAYVAPSGNSVAWCWDAPQTATISAGSIGAGVPVVNSNVGTNTLAGFSIVTWQADGSNDGGVAHGLDRKPEFIIYKARNVTNPFQIWYSAGGQNKFLLLSGNAAGSDIDTSIYSEPTADTISNYQNANGVQMVAYCWHSVPGYSAFGSYQGNSSADGPFIYTGFRPAFVMLKKTSSTGGSWVITDTTRSISNPVDEMLFANNDVGEIVSPSYVIDILSNGFKPRVADDNLNSAGNTYIYAAFAENPFGGSNVSPANAR